MANAQACLYLVIVLISILGLAHGSAWSYSGPMGPSNWGKKVVGASACLGHKQSPINIDTHTTVEKSFPPFVLSGYDLDNYIQPMPHPINMVNNGHTVQVNLEGPYQLSGGGLPHTYTAVQFHLHWGSKSNRGSEHTVNGRAYSAEMHIVHYDSTNYDHVLNAFTQPEGLAVLGFFIKLGPHNYAWDPIINHIASVRHEVDPYIFPDAFALSLLMPRDLSRFYRYNGSLTTPGCFESVIWTLFENPILLSYAQIAQLRRVYAPHHQLEGDGHPSNLAEKVEDNFRPVQRLWFRNVYQSWPRQDSSSSGTNVANTRPGWYNRFLGNDGTGPNNQRSGNAPVDEERLEDNGYGAYLGGGGGMEWFWQAMLHGEYADHQDTEYYDYYSFGHQDDAQVEDMHDSQDKPHGGGGTNNNGKDSGHNQHAEQPHGAHHGTEPSNTHSGHDQNENVPHASNEPHDPLHNQIIKPHQSGHHSDWLTNNEPQIANNNPNDVSQSQGTINQNDNVPQGTPNDPQMVTDANAHETHGTEMVTQLSGNANEPHGTDINPKMITQYSDPPQKEGQKMVTE